MQSVAFFEKMWQLRVSMKSLRTSPQADKPHMPMQVTTRMAGCDTTLWNALRAGDRHALNTIFETHVRAMYAYGRNITPDVALVSDCVQDVFTELWIRRQTLAPGVKSIRYYLFKSLRRRISRQLVIEKRLASETIPEDYGDDLEPNIEHSLVADQTVKDRSMKLNDSIATLSDRQREAIYLKFYANMAHEEIASIMKTDVKGVYNLIARSMQSLRAFFHTHPIQY